MRRLVRFYGAHPVHLVALCASFAVTGYAAWRLLPANPVGIAVWLVGAAVLHDFVLLPAYAVVDRMVHGRAREGARRPAPRPWANYVRVPLALSGLLLLVFAPSILRLSQSYYEATTQLTQDGYAWRWLVVTAVLFAASGVAYLMTGRRRASH